MDRSASVTVPPCLVELAKRVVRGFYGATSGYGDEMCAVIVDILIRMICVKEEDLVALVGVDKKAVVARLNILCKEHLIAKSEDVDPDAPPPEEGEKEVRVSFYYIDYEMMVNVVRLRLHIMQEEFRESTDSQLHNRPKAVCSVCGRGYLDTEMDRLLDPFTGMLVCADQHCKGEVNYDDSKIDVGEITSSAQSARFNEQLNPFLELLRQAEKETIVAAIAAPAPTRKAAGRGGGRAGGLKDPLKGFAVVNQTTIDFTDGDREATVKQKPKMHTAAALGSQYATGGVGAAAAAAAGDADAAVPMNIGPTVADEDILAVLRQKPQEAAAVASLKRPAEGDPDSDDEDEMVEVQGVPMPFSRITEADIGRMRPDEKTYYLQLKEYQ